MLMTYQLNIEHPRGALDVSERHQMMLNPAKYSFGIGSGKYLGLTVSKRGINTNLDKIKIILDMEPP